MDFGGFLTGFGQQAAKSATGTDPLASAQGGTMQSAPVQTTSAPMDGMHWSVMPMIGSALGLGGGSSQGGGGMSILPILSNILGGGGKGKAAAPAQAPAAAPAPTQAPVTTQPAAGTAPAGGPINTQNHVSGFHGAVPMISNWVDNHHAAARDTAAQPHIQALQQADITPEQRQYSVSHLQNIYSGQPQVLKQMGIPAPTTGYYVPSMGQNAGGK